jgi:hypothetical protein
MGTRVMISNLPPDTTADEVREALVDIGAPVLNVELLPKNKPDQCSAIVELDIEWEIAKIMQANQRVRMFKGRHLKIGVLTEVH